MRQRQASPLAVEKTSQFLNALKLFCQGESIFKTINEIHVYYHVNKSTGAACKSLEIIRKTDKGYVWIANEPTRQMALMVLNYHLERAPNTMKASTIEGLAEFTASVKSLSDIMNTIVTQNERATKGLKIASNQTGENLFTRDQQYFELVKAIASGMYAVPNSSNLSISDVNASIIFVAKDLMDKAFQ